MELPNLAFYKIIVRLIVLEHADVFAELCFLKYIGTLTTMYFVCRQYSDMIPI